MGSGGGTILYPAGTSNPSTPELYDHAHEAGQLRTLRRCTNDAGFMDLGNHVARVDNSTRNNMVINDKWNTCVKVTRDLYTYANIHAHANPHAVIGCMVDRSHYSQACTPSPTHTVRMLAHTHAWTHQPAHTDSNTGTDTDTETNTNTNTDVDTDTDTDTKDTITQPHKHIASPARTHACMHARMH